ncbi:MAG TPA: hypothetical protein VF609_07970 [Flavisolibacter sp.]
MKNFLISGLAFMVLFGCKKPATEPEVETETFGTSVASKIISLDTLSTGTFWGLSIGETPESIYTTLQSIRNERQITIIGVVGNVFTSLQDIENKIPLYTSLYFDETTGTKNGIQLSFANDKVKAIWTNDGKKLSRWPNGLVPTSTIRTGDAVTSLGAKLATLRNHPEHSKQLQRFSLFFKDAAKAFDTGMAASRQWYFGSKVADNRIYYIHLNFVAGKLQSINRTLVEYPK